MAVLPNPDPTLSKPPATPAKPRERARSPFRWLRRFLLLAGILGIAVLAVMLAAYRFGQIEQPSATTKESDIEADPSAITTGENIRYVQTSGGEVVFQVKAARSVEERSGRSHLEEVELTVPRQDGGAYVIESDKAWVDQERHQAELEGNVRITGWSDLVVEARAMEVLQQGRLMVSRGEVRFSYPGLKGRASDMRIDKNTGAVILSGGVHLHSLEGAEIPMRLDCQRLVFKRAEGLIRAVDRVNFRYGDQHLRTHYLSLFLREDQSLRTLRARWRINGGMTTTDDAGGEQQLLYHGQFLEVEPSELDPENRRVTLRGAEDQPAALSMRMPDGLARDMVAYEMVARVVAGNLSSVQAVGTPMQLDEFLDMPGEKYALRKVCAERMVAGFDDEGSLSQLYLEDQVLLADHQLHVSGGDEAVVDLARGQMQIEGEQVTLSTDRGDLTAPDITYSRNTGLIKADGGVQAILAAHAASSLAGSPLGEGDGPVSVQSRSAHWTQAPPGFVFRQDVRAWRGKNLLLAEQLRGDEASGEMAASGSVTTIWVPTNQPGAGAPSPAASPIEVTAATVSFRRSENLLIYEGGVRLLQAERRLSCNELSVEMMPSGGAAKRMECRGDVELVDPVEGQTVTGERALYEVADEVIEVFGERVRLVDANRNELVGRYLRYALGSGEARLSRSPPDASDTGSR